MATLPEEGQPRAVLPGPHHWLIAAGLLFAVTLVVPVLAGLI